MNYRILAAIVLAAAASAACSDAERTSDAVPFSGTTRVVLTQEGAHDISVYAFRQQGELFLFDTLFREGWTPEGKLFVRMPSGRYKFLFASGSGENLSLDPAPLTPQTAWEEAAFALREDPAAAGNRLPADELFLQYPASDANRVYTLGTTDVTIPARLSRAVCRIRVNLKRGYHDGTKYVEAPYTAPHSMLDQIERIELRTANAGLRVRPDAVGGAAVVQATLAASDYAASEQDGFVSLDGPLILPPADGADLEMSIRVVPAAGAGLQQTDLNVKGKAERNKNLDVTLWITSAYPVIGVEIDVAPIDREQEGDSGIWE